MSTCSTFFRGITETVLCLFRGIFSERNSVPNPRNNAVMVALPLALPPRHMALSHAWDPLRLFPAPSPSNLAALALRKPS